MHTTNAPISQRLDRTENLPQARTGSERPPVRIRSRNAQEEDVSHTPSLDTPPRPESTLERLKKIFCNFPLCKTSSLSRSTSVNTDEFIKRRVDELSKEWAHNPEGVFKEFFNAAKDHNFIDPSMPLRAAILVGALSMDIGRLEQQIVQEGAEQKEDKQAFKALAEIQCALAKKEKEEKGETADTLDYKSINFSRPEENDDFDLVHDIVMNGVS